MSPEILSNIDIEYLCKKFGVDLVACLSKQELPIRKFKPGGYIINLDNIDGAGTHWTALFIKPDGLAIYFDSFGCVYPLEVKQFCLKSKRIYNVIWSQTQIQDIAQESCGYFCIMFLHWIQSKNKIKNNQDFHLNKFINLFDTNNFHINDNILISYIKTNLLK